LTDAPGRRWEDVEVGELAFEAAWQPDERQLFLFSAATRNPHRIHYDLPYAISEGHAGLLVHGPLQRAQMARRLAEWAGPRGRLLRLSLRHRRPALVGSRLVLRAEVTGKRVEGQVHVVDLDVVERDADGQVLMPGTAALALPIGGEARAGSQEGGPRCSPRTEGE
jgi:hydroxyacyl-ACP dehydratase HTD2-like protein with hotdog domain